MQNIFKNLLVALGELMIGFGIGMIVASSFIFGETKYWVVVIVSLILGGFFIALGLTGKKKKEEKKEEQKEEKEEKKEEKRGEEESLESLATKKEEEKKEEEKEEEKTK